MTPHAFRWITRRCRRFALALLLAMATTSASAHSLDFVLQEMGDHDVAMVAGGRGYSVEELRVLLAARYASLQTSGRGLTNADLVRAAREDAAWRGLAERATQAGIVLDDAASAALGREELDYRRRLYFRRAVLGKVRPPTLKDLRAMYESEQATRYRTPARIVFEEATLRLVGDDTAAARARLEKQVEDQRSEGGSLAGLAILLAGDEAFADITSSAGSNEADSSPESWRALGSMSDGEVALRETAPGQYQFLKRVLGIAPQPIPFESALEDLHAEHHRRERVRIVGDLLDQTMNMPGVVVVEERAVLRRGTLADPDDVLVRIDGQPFTRDVLFRAGGWMMHPDMPRTLDEFRRALPTIGPVQQALFDHARTASPQPDDEPSAAFFVRTMSDTRLATLLAEREAHAEGIDAVAWLARETAAMSSAIAVDDLIGSHTHGHEARHQQPARGEVFGHGPLVNPDAPAAP